MNNSTKSDWYKEQEKIKEQINFFDSFIKAELKVADSSFIKIGYFLYDFQQSGLYSQRQSYKGSQKNFTNIADYALERFDIAKQTTYNYINVFERFGQAPGELSPKFEKFKFSQLVECLPLTDEQILTKIHLPASCREIKKIVKALVQTSGLKDKKQKEVEEEEQKPVKDSDMFLNVSVKLKSEELEFIKNLDVDISEYIRSLVVKEMERYKQYEKLDCSDYFKAKIKSKKAS